MNRALVAAVLGFVMMGCATNVDEPVDQIPDPPPQREAPAQTFGGDLRIGVTDPVMQAIVDQNNNGVGALPAKQLAVELPGK
jgi:hypothetical protein